MGWGWGWQWLEQEELYMLRSKSNLKEKVIVLFPAQAFQILSRGVNVYPSGRITKWQIWDKNRNGDDRG